MKKSPSTEKVRNYAAVNFTVTIADKIWRAMKFSGPFSASDIAMIAGATRSYVYKRFRMYRADGYIKEAGVRSTHGMGQEKLWRLTREGKKTAQNPRVKRWQPDPVIREGLEKVI